MTQYILKSPEEKERLQLQARTWEPEVEMMLNQIQIQPGWRCLDLACGAMGILGPLSRRVGPKGEVIGLDQDSDLLAAAGTYLQEEELKNVELVQGDAFKTGLPRESFDLVHARFLFTFGKNEELLDEMLNLTKPGGMVVIQDSDFTSWNYFPKRPVWKRLKEIIESALVYSGGNVNVGQETFGMLRRAKLKSVQMRAAIRALQDCHPYMRMPIVGLMAMRDLILKAKIATETEFDQAIAELEKITKDPETYALTLTLTQVWGQKP